MDFSKIKVLVTDGGGKQPLAMIFGLKELGCFVSVLCGSKLDPCFVSNKPDVKILDDCFNRRDEETFNKWLSLVQTGDYNVIMPVGEDSTNLATKHEKELGQYVKLACAPRDVYIKAFNKQITFDQAMKSGIPCPYTRQSDQAIEDFLQHVKFPIIIKPRQGLGSIGFHKFETESEFRQRLASKSFNVDDYVVQEFVHFKHRIGVNIFMDTYGNICTSYVVDVLRWFPLDAGAGVLIKTIDNPQILQYTAKLLKDLGWRGFADVGFMIDKETGEPRLLEINGRIPASIKMGFSLGYNISRQMLEMVYGENVTMYPDNTQYGKFIRHFDTDVAWFLKSPNRFKTKPSWFNWKNTEEVLFYKDDPKPFFSQFYQKMMSYRKIMKNKQH